MKALRPAYSGMGVLVKSIFWKVMLGLGVERKSDGRGEAGEAMVAAEQVCVLFGIEEIE